MTTKFGGWWNSILYFMLNLCLDASDNVSFFLVCEIWTDNYCIFVQIQKSSTSFAHKKNNSWGEQIKRMIIVIFCV